MPRMADVVEYDLEEVDGLCIAQRHAKMAREGDFEGLWQVLLTNEWGMIDQAQCFQQLLQAIEVAVRTDPQKFSAHIFAKVMSFTSYLLLRTHFQLGTVLDYHDTSMRQHGHLFSCAARQHRGQKDFGRPALGTAVCRPEQPGPVRPSVGLPGR